MTARLESWAGQPLSTPTYSIATDNPFSYLSRQGDAFATPSNHSQVIEGVVVQKIENYNRSLPKDAETMSAVRIYPISDDRGNCLPIAQGPDDANLVFYPTYVLIGSEDPPQVGSKVTCQDYFAYRCFDTTNQAVGVVLKVTSTPKDGAAFPDILSLKGLCLQKDPTAPPVPCAVTNAAAISGGRGKAPIPVPNNTNQQGKDWAEPAFILRQHTMNRPTLRYTAGRGGDPLHPKGHGGTDFGTPYGEPIYAPFSGEAEFRRQNAGADSGAGWYILMKHDQFVEPFYTLYGHLSRELTPRAFGVTGGASVRGIKKRFKKGDLIGHVYNKKDEQANRVGRSTAPHLHFEVHMGNTPFTNRAAPLESLYLPNSSPELSKGPPPSSNYGDKSTYHYTPNKFQLKSGGVA